MKKMLICFSCSLMILASTAACASTASEQAAPKVGTLTVFHALEDFKVNEEVYYKKGQLICDSNDPFNRIVEENSQNYKYEGDDTGDYYSWLLPKKSVEKKTYTMSELNVSQIGTKAIFVSRKGCVARIFKSDINEHKFCSWDGAEVNAEATQLHRNCYVLSVDFYSPYDGERYTFEDPLDIADGHFVFYLKSRFTSEDATPKDCRYREGPIGYFEEKWINNTKEWTYSKSAYTEDGRLLVDQWESVDIPDTISIAYIAELNALYVNGDLYYLMK